MASTMQNNSMVAFQGDHYAFSEIAAKNYFGEEIECLPCKSFERVFAAVEGGEAAFGIIPVENSLTGSIHRNIDLLLEKDLHIVGETFLRIEQHLIAARGVQLKDIKTVYSHPQNKGYGGNQKTCYDQAMKRNPDVIVMVHPDYQYRLLRN